MTETIGLSSECSRFSPDGRTAQPIDNTRQMKKPPLLAVPILVEAGGIEPPSENPRNQASPSAAYVFIFPLSGSHRRDPIAGSFIMPAAPQSLGGPVPYFNDAGGSSSRRLSPTHGLRPRTQKRWCYCSQLILTPILTRFGAAARFPTPRRSPSKPVRPLNRI